MDAANAMRMINVDADIKEQREDWQFVVDQDGLRLSEQFVTLGWIGGGIGQADGLVVMLIAPAGAVVAVLAHEHVEKGVGVVVVADPTAARYMVCLLYTSPSPRD